MALDCVTSHWKMRIRTDWAEEAGILEDLPTWGRPNFDQWTWDDWLEMLGATHRVAADGTVERFGYARAARGFDEIMHQWVGFGGEGVFDDNWGYKETETIIDHPDFIEVVQRMVDLTHKHKYAPTLAEVQVVEGGLYLADMALVEGAWPTYRPTDFPFEHAQWPVPFEGAWRSHHARGNHYALYKDSKQRDEGWEVLRTFTSDWHYLDAFAHDFHPPPYEGRKHIAVLEESDRKHSYQVAVSRLATATAVPELAEHTHFYSRQWGRLSGQWNTIFRAELENIWLEAKTVEQAMKDAKKQIDTEMAKIPIV
jgi:ABC-type glycerol-3-phosphate transport system substrate-binding protein